MLKCSVCSLEQCNVQFAQRPPLSPSDPLLVYMWHPNSPQSISLQKPAIMNQPVLSLSDTRIWLYKYVQDLGGIVSPAERESLCDFLMAGVMCHPTMRCRHHKELVLVIPLYKVSSSHDLAFEGIFVGSIHIRTLSPLSPPTQFVLTTTRQYIGANSNVAAIESQSNCDFDGQAE